MSRIFISYRREDSAGHAGRLFDGLEKRFGGKSVFMDVAGSIEPGLDFVETIERAVGSCDALIVMIGKDWLSCTDAQGRRRLDDPDDFIRLETATALERKIRVIPVLVQGAKMPTVDALPDNLQALARRQALELSDTRWDFDVENLGNSLGSALGGDEATRSGRKIPWLKAVVAALLILAIGWGAKSLLKASNPQPANLPKIKTTLDPGTSGSLQASDVSDAAKETTESRAAGQQDYERVQGLYTEARGERVACTSVLRNTTSLKKFLTNKKPVPEDKIYSVKNPQILKSPTIGDLARDRILRIESIRKECFERSR